MEPSGSNQPPDSPSKGIAEDPSSKGAGDVGSESYKSIDGRPPTVAPPTGLLATNGPMVSKDDDTELIGDNTSNQNVDLNQPMPVKQEEREDKKSHDIISSDYANETDDESAKNCPRVGKGKWEQSKS